VGHHGGRQVRDDDLAARGVLTPPVAAIAATVLHESRMGGLAEALVLTQRTARMNWTEPQSRPLGLDGAEAVLLSEPCLLARWNHSQCRGWQLYARRQWLSAGTRWLAGAGVESLTWTNEQAIRWAEDLIRQQPAT